MKRITIISLSLMIFGTFTMEAQLLKKLKKRTERAAEEAVIRKAEQKVYKETSKGMDSILNPKTGKREPAPTQDAPSQPPITNNPESTNEPGAAAGSGGDTSMQVYSKFDYVPGDKLLFFDDFALDFIGDFPSKWNTNGSGEVVIIGENSEKWFEIQPGYNTYYVPDVPSFPEEFTVEFDLYALGIDKKTASSTLLNVIFSQSTRLDKEYDYYYPSLPLCQYHPVGIHVRNRTQAGGAEINNNITADIREAIMNQPHISIAVNKRRFRMWVNEKKVVDIPRFVPEGLTTNQLMFEVRNLKQGKERLFIRNLKVAEGGLDLRRKLISEGQVSTNGILFDSGSANIQPQSMGIIRQIAQVLQQEKGMRLKIVGHTDSDGNDTNNQKLSEKRAAAVKEALVSIYEIDAGRLTIDGKGESEPVADNNTPNGKAQNRRVEFKQIN